ncbi:MAG: hypothetical protein ICV84_07540 [Flavisolibacter sp.]|nr:hypothetical protein [Flavisolibacter sp.]
MSVADITNQQRLPAPIETGRRYGITLEVGYDKVDGYLASPFSISVLRLNERGRKRTALK